MTQHAPAADEEGLEAERLRLYDVQWLDEPSLAQARIGEEALVKKHPGLSETALGRWVSANAAIENVQVRSCTRLAALLHSHNLITDDSIAHAAASGDSCRLKTCILERSFQKLRQGREHLEAGVVCLP